MKLLQRHLFERNLTCLSIRGEHQPILDNSCKRSYQINSAKSVHRRFGKFLAIRFAGYIAFHWLSPSFQTPSCAAARAFSEISAKHDPLPSFLTQYRANARPIPLAPPVITATESLIFEHIDLLYRSGREDRAALFFLWLQCVTGLVKAISVPAQGRVLAPFSTTIR